MASISNSQEACITSPFIVYIPITNKYLDYQTKTFHAFIGTGSWLTLVNLMFFQMNPGKQILE